MYKIYVAGAITGKDHIKFLKNVRDGIKISANILKNGCAPFCPFLDHQFLFHEDIDNEQFYKYSLEFLKVCDAVLVIGKKEDYENSIGTQKEIEEAIKINVPIIYLENNDIETFIEEIKNIILKHKTIYNFAYNNFDYILSSSKASTSFNINTEPFKEQNDITKLIDALLEDNINKIKEVICTYDRKEIYKEIESIYEAALIHRELDGFWLILENFRPSYWLAKKLIKKIENDEVLIGNVRKYHALKRISTRLNLYIPDFKSTKTMGKIKEIKEIFDNHVKIVEYDNIDLLHYYDIAGAFPVDKHVWEFYKTEVKCKDKNIKRMFYYIERNKNEPILHLEKFNMTANKDILLAIKNYLKINNYNGFCYTACQKSTDNLDFTFLPNLNQHI